MKISRLPLFAAILPLAAAPLLVPAQLHADTYKLVDLGTDNFRQIVQIDNLGQVVIFNTSSDEYLTYANGVRCQHDEYSSQPHLRQWNPLQRAAGIPYSG